MAVVLFNIPEFIGRFHPVLVHLPIGILLLAALFQLLSLKEKFRSLQAAVGITLLLGMLSAIASCISGFLLSKTDDYDEALIFKHQWFGISVAVISIVAWVLHNRKNEQIKWLMGIMILLIVITGHLGGSITHGSDYLSRVFSSDEKSTVAKRKPIPNVQEALAYNDVVKPILESKCYGCHGTNKQKGKLRLDQPDFILKGGKDGKVLDASQPDESVLLKRLLLSKESKDHMPPKEKAQLSRQELDLLHWWIAGGGDFTKKVKELAQTNKIKPVLTSLQSAEIREEISVPDIPAKPVENAAPSLIKALQERGVAILPVAQNSNYLSANFVAVEGFTEIDLQLLLPISKQLAWLKLGNKNITDTNLSTIAKLSSLTRLFLDKTKVTDKGMVQLKNLTQLQYLNLVGTKVTVKGLEQLKELKSLQQLYLYQTAITGNDWNNLKKVFPKTMIDSGGYTVQLLESDTTEKKAAVIN